jgi:hypothetical protein
MAWQQRSHGAGARLMRLLPDSYFLLVFKGARTMSSEPHEPDDRESESAWKNIGKIIFLIAVLVAAWFVLERLMGSK